MPALEGRGVNMDSWTISRSKSKDGLGFHIQARSGDQLNSFATVVLKGASILRSKTADGKSDCFTLTQLEPHVTFNVVGKIKYIHDWTSELA